MTLTDAAAGAAEIPNLVIRPYAGETDLPEIVRVTNAELAADGVDERESATNLAAEFRHASDAFDASRDVLVAEVDGVFVGSVRISWVDATDGKREYRSRCTSARVSFSVASMGSAASSVRGRITSRARLL